MNRVWIGVAAAVAVLVVPYVAVRPAPPNLQGDPITTSFEHSVVGFGDRVHARAVVILDSSAPDNWRVNVNLAPLAQLGTPRVTRTTGNGKTQVTYDVDAVCIYEECVGKGGRKLVQLLPVSVQLPDGSVLLSAPWPPLDVRGRIVAADLEPTEPPLKANVTPPRVDYRVAPSTLAALLTALAALLAVGGIALAGRQVVAIRRDRSGAEPSTELERALALARESESRPAPDRRRALALLERVLLSRDARLAREARDLAWSPPTPEPGELDELVTEVESKVGR